MAASSIPLILASASPRRLELLQQIGIVPQEVLAAAIDETPERGEVPRAYAMRVAREKGKAVFTQRPEAIVLSADTVVACGRRILGKPENEAEARAFLQLLSGRKHRVYTAVSLYSPDGREWHKAVMTHVMFKRLHAAELDAYIASGEWQGKAGGYAIQGRAAAFVPSLNGSYSNVVGLPLAQTFALLSAAGIVPSA